MATPNLADPQLSQRLAELEQWKREEDARYQAVADFYDPRPKQRFTAGPTPIVPERTTKTRIGEVLAQPAIRALSVLISLRDGAAWLYCWTRHRRQWRREDTGLSVSAYCARCNKERRFSSRLQDGY